MKRIEAIVRPEAVRAVLDTLQEAGYPGVMVTEIEGHGRQKGITQSWRGQEYKIDLLPKAKLEIVVADAEVDKIVDQVAAKARTGQMGDGKIFVTDVADAVRIRTGERGDKALV